MKTQASNHACHGVGARSPLAAEVLRSAFALHRIAWRFGLRCAGGPSVLLLLAS
jgi:hypothetical protein